MIELVIPVSEKLPPLDANVSKTRKTFFCLGIAADARRYLTFTVLSGILAAIMMFILSWNISIAAVVGLAALAFFHFLPGLERGRMESEMEAELPLFLRDLGALINMGIPFLSALSMLSQRRGTLNREIGKAVKEILKGASPASALADLGSRAERAGVKRAMAQIIGAYEQGGGGSELKRMGNDLMNEQRHRLREYAAKSSIYAIFFIMVAVIGPTFYMISGIVGPVLYGKGQPDSAMGPIMLVLFPAISYLVLLMGRMAMPRTSFSQKGQVPKGILISIPVALVLILPIEMWLKAIVLAAVLVAAISLFVKRYVEDAKLGKLESNLPNALLLISSLPRGTTFQKVVERLANSDLEGVREEFRKTLNQLRANISPESAIRDMVERNRSPLLAKVMETMDHVYRAGGNVNERITEMADDLLLFQESRREQNSMMAMQKYSVILGMLIMPLVLAMAMGIAGKMGGIIDVEINIGQLAEGLILAYLAINAGIISDFCASLESDRSRELVYFSALSVAGIAIFLAVSFFQLI
jgi:Flp pilus assembly protein TadB